MRLELRVKDIFLIKAGFNSFRPDKSLFQSVIGEVTANDIRRGGAILVAPRLILTAADVLPEKTIEPTAFQVLDCSSAVVRVWRVGECSG
jgi:hypothetical protein